MINGEAVMQQVRQGVAPSYWRVLPAKQSHFIGVIAGYTVGALLVFALLLYLIVDPGFVVGLKGAVNVESLHSFWRTVDFVVVGAFVLACLALVFVGVRNLGTVGQQALVLLPEGFVMQKGSEKKTMTVIEYSAISGLTTSVSNGRWSLLMPRATGKGIIKLDLDGRYGAPKQIASMLREARAQYAMARAAH